MICGCEGTLLSLTARSTAAAAASCSRTLESLSALFARKQSSPRQAVPPGKLRKREIFSYGTPILDRAALRKTKAKQLLPQFRVRFRKCVDGEFQVSA